MDRFHSDDPAVEKMIVTAKINIAKTRVKLIKLLFDPCLEVPGGLPGYEMAGIAAMIGTVLRDRPDDLADFAQALSGFCGKAVVPAADITEADDDIAEADDDMLDTIEKLEIFK